MSIAIAMAYVAVSKKFRNFSEFLDNPTQKWTGSFKEEFWIEKIALHLPSYWDSNTVSQIKRLAVYFANVHCEMSAPF